MQRVFFRTSSQGSITRMPHHTFPLAMMNWLSPQVSFVFFFALKIQHPSFVINITASNHAAPPSQIQPAKERANGHACSHFEEDTTTSKGDDEGIFVTRASASYIHALREALGRKILFSAYPQSNSKRLSHVEPGNSAEGSFIDVNNQFSMVNIDDVVFAECIGDNFLVRCSDNAAFSGSTGYFIGYWQNEGYIRTD